MPMLNQQVVAAYNALNGRKSNVTAKNKNRRTYLTEKASMAVSMAPTPDPK